MWSDTIEVEVVVDIPVERCPNLGQEHFVVLAAKILLCSIPHFLEGFAACHTRLGVDSRKGQVVVPRLEICSFLLRQLDRKPGDDS